MVDSFDKRFVKGKHGKSHVQYPPFHERGNNGIEKILLEPVPKFFERDGDAQITAANFGGVDNNASIIFGRDRTGVGEIDSPFTLTKEGTNKETLGINSFGDYMGAGAIDIVVGRMAPFPLAMEGFSVGPMFRTATNIPELSLETLDGQENGENFITQHPQFAMDAARIYISQMSSVDETFGIAKNPKKTSMAVPTKGATEVALEGGFKMETENKLTAHSSIMIKADKVRMHSRHDIKIVTGGEAYDSQGEPIMTTGGIHLIAGNRKGENQPIPLGYNLEACLQEVLYVSKETLKIMARFCKRQMAYNDVLSSHEHMSPFGPGLMCTPSITGAPTGTYTVVHQFIGVQKQIDNLLSEIIRVRSTFLDPPTTQTSNKRYINSVNNTTN